MKQIAVIEQRLAAKNKIKDKLRHKIVARTVVTFMPEIHYSYRIEPK